MLNKTRKQVLKCTNFNMDIIQKLNNQYKQKQRINKIIIQLHFLNLKINIALLKTENYVLIRQNVSKVGKQ